MIAAYRLPLPGRDTLQDRRKLLSPLAALSSWQLRRRYRADLRRLLRLGVYLIDDLGLDRVEAVREAHKPLWQA